jgi:hypothetical protein
MPMVTRNADSKLIRRFAIIVALVSCSPAGTEYEAAERPDEDLQEAALRWAFANAETDLEDPAVYCIAASPGPLDDGVDPDAGFLARFRQQSIPVRPVSACRFEGDVMHIVVDRASGSFGLLFTVSPVLWESRDRGMVPIGYLQGGLWGAGWECVVERDGEDWIVPRCRRVLDV